MKRHSILTNQFPQVGFHHFSVSELLKSGQRDFNASFRGRALSSSTGHQADFLPPVHYHGSTFLTDLFCCELDQEESARILAQSKGASRSSLGAAYINVKDLDTNQYCELPEVRRRIQKGDKGNFRFQLVIFLDSIYSNLQEKGGQGMGSRSSLDLLCERKVLFAKELTTVYRNYVNAWLYLFGQMASPPIGQRSKPTLMGHFSHHPTDEGAWRLVCGFTSIWTIFAKFSCFPQFRNINTPSDYLRFKTEYPDDHDSYLEFWKREERVPAYIVEKKTFEYFIYKSI